MRQADVGQAADQRAAQAGQLREQSLVLLLDHLVLVLNGLQVHLHGGDLQHTAGGGGSTRVPLQTHDIIGDNQDGQTLLSIYMQRTCNFILKVKVNICEISQIGIFRLGHGYLVVLRMQSQLLLLHIHCMSPCLLEGTYPCTHVSV